MKIKITNSNCFFFGGIFEVDEILSYDAVLVKTKDNRLVVFGASEYEIVEGADIYNKTKS